MPDIDPINNFTAIGPDGAPVTPDIPPPNYKDKAVQGFEGLVGDGLVERIALAIAGAIIKVLQWLMRTAGRIASLWFAMIGNVLSEGQAAKSPEFAELTAAVMSDLLGEKVDPVIFQQAMSDHGTVSEMERIGGVLWNLLTTEFTMPEQIGTGHVGERPGAGSQGAGDAGALTPEQGIINAQRFLGFVMAFAIRAGNVAVITEACSVGFLKNFREYGEAMAHNLGLGRHARSALKPLIDVCISDPLTKGLHQQYRPTGLPEGQAVKAWIRGLITETDLNTMLARKGYKDELIEFIKADAMVQPSFGELARMVRWNAMPLSTALTRLRRKGITSADAGMMMQDYDLQRCDSRAEGVVSLIVSLAQDRYLDTDLVQPMLADLPLTDAERALIRLQIGLYLDHHRPRFTVSQCEAMYVDDVITLSEFMDRIQQLGWSVEDQQLLKILALTKKNTADTSAAAKAAKAAAAVAAAAAKAAKAAALAVPGAIIPKRQQLTTAQATTAYRSGVWTADDLHSYLVSTGYTAAQANTLVDSVKISAPSGSLGPGPGAGAAAGAGASRLTNNQVQQAVIDGVATMNDYRAYLAAQKYTTWDVATLTAALTIRKAKSDQAAAAASQRADLLATTRLTLRQVQEAFDEGLYDDAAFLNWLTDEGYTEGDAHILLTESQSAKAALTAARIAAAGKVTEQPFRQLSLRQAEDAFAGALIPDSAYTLYLSKSGYSSVDAAVLLAQARQRKAAADQAAAAAAAAGALGGTRTLTQREVERAYVQSIITQDQAIQDLSDIGFAPDAIAVLLQLWDRIQAAAAALAYATAHPS